MKSGMIAAQCCTMVTAGAAFEPKLREPGGTR